MIDAKKLGVAGGILWGGCMLISTVISIYTGFAIDFLNIMKGVYPGYSITWPGSFLGFIYGFFDAGIGFFLLAWIYNKLGGSTNNT
jgi:hypothetical protein